MFPVGQTYIELLESDRTGTETSSTRRGLRIV